MDVLSSDPVPEGWLRPWHETEHVVLDLEMTGRDANQDRICELALVRRDSRGRTCLEINSLVRNEGVSVGASREVHGIDDASLANAPPLSELREQLAAAVSGAVLVGHRIAFDLAFLAAAAERGEISPMPVHALDTARLAERAFHGLPSSLRGLCESLSLPAPSHRAMADVIATSALFDRVHAELAPHCAEDLWIAQQGDGRARIRRDHAALASTALDAGMCIEVTYRVPGRPADTFAFEPWTVTEGHVEGRIRGMEQRVLRGDRILRMGRTDVPFARPERVRSLLPK